jgi:hypothetical protein
MNHPPTAEAVAARLGLDLSEVDVDIQTIRLVLRAQGALEELDLSRAPFPHAISVLRHARIEKDGLRCYLYDMLGDRANRRASRATLWYGEEVYPVNGRGDEPLIDLLTDLARSVGLPDKVAFDERDRQSVFYI